MGMKDRSRSWAGQRVHVLPVSPSQSLRLIFFTEKRADLQGPSSVSLQPFRCLAHALSHPSQASATARSQSHDREPQGP